MKRINYVLPHGKEKALTFSYDDGRTADRKLVEIFNKYRMKGSFHLNSTFFGRDGYIEEKEVADLFQGHEISCHSATHPDLRRQGNEKIIEEIITDRKNLEKIAKYPVKGMSYPFGTFTPNVISLLKSLGIVYNRTTLSTGKFNFPDEYMTWHPTCHHNNCLEHIENFNKVRSYCLFYVWGHSYEFDNAGNWPLIEDFCSRMANRDEVWYATNIEIYNYQKLLSELQFSADSSIVKNPMAESAWLSIDNEIVEVKPGQILNIG